MAVCYRCGQPGHLAKECKTAVYNLSDTTYEQQHDNTAQWYYPNNGFDASWYSSDQTGYFQDSGQQYQQPQQTSQLALTAPQHTAAQEQQTPAIHLVATLDNKMSTTPTASTPQSVQQYETKGRHHDRQWCSNTCLPTMACAQLTHVHTATWAGAATEDSNTRSIPAYGYKWVLMTNITKQQLVVPFLVCEVTQPTMSVTRLAEQGFNIQLNETPTVTHTKGFNSALVQRDGLYFMTMEFVNIPVNMQLEVHEATHGTTAQIAPVTLTPTGMEVWRNRNDLWTFNSQGIWSEYTGHNAKHSLYQINSVQFQQGGWQQ